MAIYVDHHQSFWLPRITREVEGILTREMIGEVLVAQVAQAGPIAKMAQNLLVAVAMVDRPVPVVAIIKVADPFAKPSCDCFVLLPHFRLPIKNPLGNLAATEWATVIWGLTPCFLLIGPRLCSACVITVTLTIYI